MGSVSPSIVPSQVSAEQGTITYEARPRLLVWAAADEKGIERLSDPYSEYLHQKSADLDYPT